MTSKPKSCSHLFANRFAEAGREPHVAAAELRDVATSAERGKLKREALQIPSDQNEHTL